MVQHQEFRADGECVWVEPVEKRNADGSLSITLGFKLCVMTEAGEGNAEGVAQMLSLHGPMLDALKGLYALMDDGDGLSAADPEESAIAYARSIIERAEAA